MKGSIQKSRGYFTIIIALLLMTVAFSSLIISYQYANKALAMNASLTSMQAYYLAKSGLERAKYDITKNNVKCSQINGAANNTNATFPTAAGQFTVTANQVTKAASLSAAIDASVTTIPLTTTNGFESKGTLVVDSEVINYMGLTPNSVTGATRGIGGSIAVGHAAGAPVVQNICVLTSMGAVPTMASPITQRTIQEVLIGSTFAVDSGSGGPGSGAGSGLMQAAVVIGGAVSLSGNATITNSTITANSPNFPGSTIISGGPISMSGSATTQISNGAGGLVTSSSRSVSNADVKQNVSQVNSGNIWSAFFSQSKATVQASANQSYTGSNISGATGQTIWTNTLDLSGNTVIGSLTSPVILIVNGSLNISGNTTIIGFVYVTGTVNLSGNTTVTGLFAMEGSLSASGNLDIYYNPNVLTLSGNTNTNSNISYSPYSASTQEQFV